MKLRRYFLFGIGGTVIALTAIILLASQFILANNYQQLETQDVKAQVQQVVDTFQNDIGSFNITDIHWAAPPQPRPAPTGQGRGNVDLRLVEKIGFDTGSAVMVLDQENNIIFRNQGKSSANHAAPSIPTSVLPEMPSENPFTNAHNTQRPLKGLINLPEGTLMMVSIPLPAGGGRIIWGRYFDEAEIQHLSDVTNLDIQAVSYDEDNVPAEFQRAKNNLSNADSFYSEAENNHTLAGYRLMNDVYGKPSIILRIQIPRTIYQVGQGGLTNFALVLILCVIAAGGACYLLLEQVILGSTTPPAAATTYQIDEFNKLATGIQSLIAARIVVEQKLQESYAKLESRVEERTSELFTINAGLQQQLDTNKQIQAALAEARDKALESLQARSQMLANVSHDARTPLTIINLNTEMLQQGRHGEMNAKQNEVLDRILTATRQLFNFMSNMLGESQLENGKISLVKMVYEPKLLVEGLVSMLKPLAENKGLAMHVEADLALPSNTMGDPERLKQVITNLCENAIKFTKTGEIQVKAYRKDQFNWVIQVHDTGCGIPREAQNRIFEAYWQVENTGIPSANRGVGLGLSIVKQLVQLMNGTITVESEVGKGTIFTVTLPLENDSPQLVIEPIKQPNRIANPSSFEFS